MIERPAPNADYLDRPEVRARLRARPVASYLGARRGGAGYAVLVLVAAAGAVAGWRSVSPWLGVALGVVVLQAAVDWLIAWYRVASLAYRDAVAGEHRDPPDTDGESGPAA